MIPLLKYKFDSIEMEQRYKAANFSKDRQHTTYIFSFCVVLLIAHIFFDFSIVKEKTSLVISIATRILAASSLITGIIFLYRSKKHSYDSIVMKVIIVIILHTMAITITRPEGFMISAVWDIVIIFGIYTAIPLRLIYQITSAMLLTIGSSIIWIFFREPIWHNHEPLSMFSAYYSVNIIGIFISIQFKKYRRKQFELLELERTAREGLERSQKEVKVLRGILPICSFCKKIRNDEGYYEKVDAYITKHSEVDFSHTVCPDCLKEHYPEMCDETKKIIEKKTDIKKEEPVI